MIRINLMSRDCDGNRSHCIRWIAWVVPVAMLYLAILASLHVMWTQRLDDLAEQFSGAVDTGEGYARLNQAVIEARRHLQGLDERQQWAKTLKAEQQRTAKLLVGIGDLVIGGALWLEQFHIRGSVVSINGTAHNERVVTLFLARLKSSALFRKVALRTIQEEVSSPGQNYHGFEISCDVER